MSNTNHEISRREFLTATARTAGGLAIVGALPTALLAAPGKVAAAPESLAKTLHASLTPHQKELLCLPWTDPRRTKVAANWAIVEPTLGNVLTADQKEMARQIVRGLTTDEWYPKLLAQMQNDAGGFENYHLALFGDPKTDTFECVVTGRHVTLRADGSKADSGAAFGGPIFYGHAPKETEDAAHPGNIYWPQAQKANKVFDALDGKQRALSLLAQAPPENKIALQGTKGDFPGLPVGALSRDQKQLVQSVMRDILAPYRPSDADAVMRDIAANGGIDNLHLAFYKQDDLGGDSVWDIWRLEGPALVWHFRGAPHVHTWVNVAKNAQAAEGHV